MLPVSEIIESSRHDILRRWTDAVRRMAPPPGRSGAALDDVVPAFLATLGRGNDTAGPQLHSHQLELIERHLSQRIRQGFVLNEILTEFSALSSSMSQVFANLANDSRPSTAEVARLFAELNLAAMAATTIFNEHMLEDEQTEKRYRRQVQIVASRALTRPHASSTTLRKDLRDILTIVMEATGVASVAVLLYDAEQERLVRSMAIGRAHQLLEHHLAIHASSSTWGSEEAPAQVSDALRAEGLFSLLGVQMALQEPWRGAVYVASDRAHGFSASERRRLDAMSDTLSLYLEASQVGGAREHEVTRLESEGRLRERFIAVLMHDLKAPLQTAQAHAHELALARPDAAGHGLSKIVRELRHMQRMVDSLVDAHEIRAGQRPVLDLAECDLGEVARAAIEELRGAQRGRVTLEAEKNVRGVWSAELLQRALWNLVLNGLQHGSKGGPVVVRVERGASRSVVTVHNLGPALSHADQAKLFHPFLAEGAAMTEHPPGWGLGLTLVWSCVEAHGGKISVDSDDERGTTFTLTLPNDARPYAG